MAPFHQYPYSPMPNNKIYLVSFDPHVSDGQKLHTVISNCNLISHWWHFLGSTYLLYSTNSLTEITIYIRAGWPNQSFLIIEVNPKSCDGWLPQAAWSWINERKDKVS